MLPIIFVQGWLEIFTGNKIKENQEWNDDTFRSYENILEFHSEKHFTTRYYFLVKENNKYHCSFFGSVQRLPFAIFMIDLNRFLNSMKQTDSASDWTCQPKSNFILLFLETSVQKGV